MSEQSAKPIPPDFAEAFADAVLAYKNWTPEQPERLIKIGPRFYSIISVCDFLDRFTSPLPEHIYQKLRSCMHDMPHGEVIADMERDSSYAAGARCLRKMIKLRIQDHRRREELGRNREPLPAALVDTIES
jgi:hypothetical protein